MPMRTAENDWKLKAIFARLNNEHLLQITTKINLVLSFNTQRTTLVRRVTGL
jgi:hypothetical protein